MPYILKERRLQYKPELEELVRNLRSHDFEAGDLVYVFYFIVKEAFAYYPRFSSINKVRGALSSALTEFDRRIAAPYEDEKIEENGDV